jgi:hypothetical protein
MATFLGKPRYLSKPSACSGMQSLVPIDGRKPSTGALTRRLRRRGRRLAHLRVLLRLGLRLGQRGSTAGPRGAVSSSGGGGGGGGRAEVAGVLDLGRGDGGAGAGGEAGRRGGGALGGARGIARRVGGVVGRVLRRGGLLAAVAGRGAAGAGGGLAVVGALAPEGLVLRLWGLVSGRVARTGCFWIRERERSATYSGRRAVAAIGTINVVFRQSLEMLEQEGLLHLQLVDGLGNASLAQVACGIALLDFSNPSFQLHAFDVVCLLD